jgi:hypothetical protein
LPLDHGHLIHNEPVVAIGIVKVNQPTLVAFNAPVRSAVLNVDAAGQSSVKNAITLEQSGVVRNERPAGSLLTRLMGDMWVQASESGAKAAFEDDVRPSGTFGSGSVGSDDLAVEVGVAQFAKVFDGREFYGALSE